jgi:hypothetical protein
VTVNLTSLLVLTTLFISVSGSLPKTAYVKMIDIWLIFAQLIPFVEVLLHTYMDTLRVGEEGGEREVNHHGKTITVSANRDPDEVPSLSPWSGANTVINTRLVSRDEQEMVEARRDFYKNVGTKKVFLKTLGVDCCIFLLFLLGLWFESFSVCIEKD